MHLKEWAIAQGIHPNTAYTWFREGTMPVDARRVGKRTILVDVAPNIPPVKVDNTAVYARVASYDQKHDLDGQVARLAVFAASNDFKVAKVVTEIGSGMNGKRVKLNKLLADPSVTTIIVEHRDRLGRMNTELVESALEAAGRKLVVVDDTELNDDLVEDMVAVLTSFCARLYGKRGAKNRALKAVGVVTDAAETPQNVGKSVVSA